jgi:hypothetical protein
MSRFDTSTDQQNPLLAFSQPASRGSDAASAANAHRPSGCLSRLPTRPGELAQTMTTSANVPSASSTSLPARYPCTFAEGAAL